MTGLAQKNRDLYRRCDRFLAGEVLSSSTSGFPASKKQKNKQLTNMNIDGNILISRYVGLVNAELIAHYICLGSMSLSHTGFMQMKELISLVTSPQNWLAP